jgi:DNA-binding PadR family transcriptional regulator
MYPYSFLPKPLKPAEYYILLALAHSPSHTYALIGKVLNYSLGSVTISDKKLYSLIQHLAETALIEPIGEKPSGKSGTPRLHYTLTEHGHIRLQEEFQRLNHAVQLSHNLGIGNPLP